jgi:hypothetical protein
MDRGDYLAKRGTSLIDENNDLLPENVGGQVVGIPFTVINLAISQTGQDALFCGQTGITQVVAPKAGSIVGLSVRSNADITAGTATFEATIAGTAISGTALDCVLSDLVQGTYKWQNKDVSGSTFAAGALLGVDATSSGTLAPVTLDYSIVLWIEI